VRLLPQGFFKCKAKSPAIRSRFCRGATIGRGLCPGSEMGHTGCMTGQPPDDSSKDARKERLARQLRANLARRKAQARAKRSGDADMRPDGLAATKDTPPKDGDRDKDGN
jgi:hypothetical protein